MKINIYKIIFRPLTLLISLVFLGLSLFAADKDFPDKPNPPALVNDLAHMLQPGEVQQLENKLDEYSRSWSTEITIVTITSIGDYDVADYAIKLGKKWGVGKSGKNNGVVILVALQEHKMWIATGKGLEGALTDYTCGKIRDKMTPFLKAGQYAAAFNEGADDVIAATKGEFKGDPDQNNTNARVGKRLPRTAIIIVIIFIYFIIRMFGRGGGGNNRGGGMGNFLGGMLLGNMLGGGFGGRDRDGGGSFGGGGGGFGGFGGGDFGGGGAGGSW